MSWLQWLLGQRTSSSLLEVVLPFFGGIVASVLAWLGVRSTRTAPLQESVNDALRLLMKELQTLHVQDTARICELEEEVSRKDGEIRQQKQRFYSLIDLYRRAGLSLPKEIEDA